MAYAKQAVQKYPTLDSVYVTTCFSGTVLTWAQRGQVAAGRRLLRQRTLLTVYPWYEAGADPSNIDKQMQWSWDNGLKQVQRATRQIVIAEIGWQSAGGRATSVKTKGSTTKRRRSG